MVVLTGLPCKVRMFSRSITSACSVRNRTLWLSCSLPEDRLMTQLLLPVPWTPCTLWSDHRPELGL